MTSMNPSTLTPPILPTTTGGYPGGRSSPMLQTPLPPASVSSSPHRDPVVVERPPRDRPQCWDHGCNGREFSTFSNLLRHQREKSGTASKAYCPRCGAEFTRTTARNGHMEHGKCKSRRPSVADTTSSNPSNASMPR
ncbi:MAG: hypothetical protein LQ340_004264 [Diploschistes diacapsis]|nr:MAG: hypothetical protein LQ340_004264 [Diploschistes diacapsis]